MKHPATRHAALATLICLAAACTGDEATDVIDAANDLGEPDATRATDAPDAPDGGSPDVADAPDGGGLDVAPDTGCGDRSGDPRNCGRCGNDCTALAGVRADRVACVAGACALAGACAAGRADCDSTASNGCEASLDTAAHCGACGTACGEPAPVCAAGACASGCGGATPVRCGGSCVDTAGDALHCGGCGAACPTPTNGAASCSAGACGVVCRPGFHLCGASCVSGSAVGTCGTGCSPCAAPAHAAATCDGTACGFTCNAGFGDCDGMAANGCEADLGATAASCGACGTACPAAPNGTPACVAGACTATCNAGFHLCGGACAADAAVATCGGLCSPCASAPNATATCDGSACGLRCGTGYGNCDGSAANGCETDVTRTLAHCGGCGSACPVPTHGAATCVASACGVACAAGYYGPTCEDTNPCGGAASAGARLAWEIALPLAAEWNAPADVAYALDRRGDLGAFAWTRVAFCLRLNDDYAYAEMDDFTGRDLARIGPPMDWDYVQAVTSLTVRSNVAGVANVSGASTGRIEFSNNCYGTGLNAVYDYNDDFGGADCYGSFQVHNVPSTVLSWNSWSNPNDNDDVGIGSQVGGSGHPDWTFAYNTASYATRVLRAYVVP